MKGQRLVCYLSVILYIYAKIGQKCSNFNIFESFTKHICKPKRHYLKIVDTPLTKRKHGTYETQARYLRCANTAITKRKHGIYETQTRQLRSANTAITKRKHGSYDAQTRQLRNANTAITKRDVNNKLCESSLNRY